MDDRLSADTVEVYVLPLRNLPDPLERFVRSGVAAAHHRAVADELFRLRALAALEMSEAGDSLATIARATGLSRARAQRLVEQGREARTHTEPTT